MDVGRGHRAIRPGTVLDDHGLAERRAERIGKDAADRIAGAAGPERKQSDRPGRIVSARTMPLRPRARPRPRERRRAFSWLPSLMAQIFGCWRVGLAAAQALPAGEDSRFNAAGGLRRLLPAGRSSRAARRDLALWRTSETGGYLMNVPLRSSAKACCNSACCSSDRPVPGDRLLDRLAGDRRKRMPCSPACTVTSSPRSNSTSERLPVCSRTVSLRRRSSRSARRTASKRRENRPSPRTRRQKHAARFRPAASCACPPAPRYRDSADRGDALDRAALAQKWPQTTRTRVPSSSTTSGISAALTSW